MVSGVRCPLGADHPITYAPERIREAVLAGVTAWLDAGVVVIQAREGITEREFGRFRRRGIPSLAVQGLRQQGFRGRSDKARLYRNSPDSPTRFGCLTNGARAVVAIEKLSPCCGSCRIKLVDGGEPPIRERDTRKKWT